MATKYLNLRWKIGGFLVSEIGPVYIGGRTEYVFNIDFDHLSIPELLDYAKDFGLKELSKTYIMPSKGGNLVELTKDRDLLDLGLFLNDGDTIDIYVCNEEGSGDVGLAACHVSGREVSGDQLTRVDVSLSHQGEASNAPTTHGFGNLNSTVSYPNLGYETPLNTAETIEENKEVEDVGSTSEEESGSGEDSDQSIDYGSDVHEELRVVRQDVKTSNRQRRKKNRKEAPTGFLGEAGIDEGYEDIDRSKKDLKDKLGGDEPYYDSSDPDSFFSESEGEAVSDDEEEVNSLGNLRARRKSNKVLHDPTAQLVVWQCGMVFENVYQFREALTKYALKKKVQLDKHVNEKNRIRVRCKSGCPWMLYASKEGRSSDFTIKTYNPRHKCTKTTVNFLCNSKFLAKHYKDRIIQHPRIKGWEIQQLVRKELGVHVGKAVSLRTRKLILQEVMGDHVSEFNRILDYKDVLLQTNPGSTCVVKVSDVEDGRKEFVGFYICFDAMKKGFMEGCRKCIGLDGCFLKGISKGQLLVAVAKDGNNQMFPVAWAVVGTETKATWKWFIKILKEDINLGDGHEVTIISDMQKGLIAAVEEVLPACEHRMCARHILSNWSKKWRGIEMRNRFWSCVRSTFESELKDMLDELNKLGTNICEDLITYNKERWCKAYFKTFSKCDSVDNNMAESFNSWILEPRHKTIVSMLEEIRTKIMNRFAKIRAFADTWDYEISPMAMNVFNKNVERSMECEILWNADYGYEVFDDPYRHTVDLRKLTCSCRSWELKGIPCPHGIAAMHHKQMDASQVITAWYRKDTYMKAYSSFIQPVPNMKMWPDSTNPKVDPPPVRRMPGRPRRNRRKEIGEVKKGGKLSKRGTAMTCSICKSNTHNKRGCPSKPKTTSTTECNSSQHSSTKNSEKRAEDEGEGGAVSRGGQTRKGRSGYKRTKVVGHGVFVSQTGYTCVNQGTTSRRKVYTGTSMKSSSHVTGDIGYEPSKALKWKGQQAISQGQLQMQSAMHQIKARSEAQAKKTT